MKKRSIITIILSVILVVFSVCTFVACNKGEVDAIYKPTDIAYDGVTLTWSKVPLASYYNVSVNGGEKKRCNTNSFAYPSTAEFEVTVYAVISDKGVEGSETKTFRPLGKVADIRVADDGGISWGGVEGATAYRISVNGTVSEDTVSDTYYRPAAGSNRIKVKAVGSDDSYYAVWSDEKSLYINNVPTSIKYDGENVTWVGNALTYSVTLTSDGNVKTETVTAPKIAYNANNKDFTVQVKAIGDHSATFDSVPAEDSFHYLAAISAMTVEDGKLNWTEIGGAEGYKIKINDVVQNATLNETCYDKLVPGVSLRVRVIPYNNSGNYFSVWSEEKSIYILPAPEATFHSDANLDGESVAAYVWNKVDGAAGYQIFVERDGVVIDKSQFGEQESSYSNAFADAGEYRIAVKAVAATGVDAYDSKFCKQIVVRRLEAPKPAVSDYIVSDLSNVARGFTVAYKGVNGAAGYQLYKDGTALDSKYVTALSVTDTGVADGTVTAKQEYNYYVRSMGSNTGNGVRVANGETYVTLPCLSSAALKFNITVQAMPEQFDISGFVTSWSEVTGNNGYVLDIDGNSNNAQSNNWDLSTLTAGNHVVKVCTKGNGADVLASNYTATLNIQRLAAPTGIKITYATSGGKLEWNDASDLGSYNVYINGILQNFTENEIDNMYKFIAENGTTVNMTSVANKWKDDARSLYIMTSVFSDTKMFYRLAAPTFPVSVFANSSEMVWNAPGNVNAEYAPKYEITVNKVTYTGYLDGPSFSLTSLEGGNSYTFKVKAIGNDVKYLTSEFSDEVTVYKLSTPTMNIDTANNAYTWTNVTEQFLPNTYQLEINGVKVKDEQYSLSGNYSYQPSFVSAGSYTVKLYAVGDGSTTINSDSFVYNQTVAKQSAPIIEYAYGAEYFIKDTPITVSIVSPIAYCSRYQYEIAGETIVSGETSIAKAIENSGVKTIKVKALGGDFDENEVYYVDSAYTQEYSLTLLGTPTKSTFGINVNGVISWSGVNYAIAYNYKIALGDGEFSEEVRTTGTSTTYIENFRNRDYSKVRIMLQVVGNGDTRISSEWITVVLDV